MTDREKVIKGLETIKQFFGYGLPSTAEMFDSYYGTLNDAIALLQEQEAKNVVNMTLSKDCFLIASCPKCNALLTRVEHKNYCGYCGQAVKWE